MILTSDFSVKFDNYDIAAIANILLTSRRPNSLPDRDINTVQLIRQDGGIVVGDRYIKKVIPVDAYILAGSRQDYEATMDELKYRLSAIQRPLVLIQAGAERVYTASLDNIVEGFIEGGNSKITMNFVANNPYGTDASTVTYDSGTFTDSPHSFDHIFQGFAKVLPQMTLTLSAVTGGTNKTVNIGNGISNQLISITRNWTAGDVILINNLYQQVAVNGGVVDFSGFFSSFNPYTAFASYSDNFTTRTARMLIAYSKRYL